MNYNDLLWIIVGVVFLFFAYFIFAKTEDFKGFYNKRLYNPFSTFQKKPFMSDKDYNLWIKFIGVMLGIIGILSVSVGILSILNIKLYI